ncbi:hypothetical protein PIB30_028295 [Stylosanthes scabra]|uniref:Uncharacterized protein n=1 Tax=Stylosanthes scabra TaxID=79078 RepID=A0ABU6XB08_9FABA|nr:hypothetical protein [Stylosanthes scabra]
MWWSQEAATAAVAPSSSRCDDLVNEREIENLLQREGRERATFSQRNRECVPSLVGGSGYGDGDVHMAKEKERPSMTHTHTHRGVDGDGKRLEGGASGGFSWAFFRRRRWLLGGGME